MKKDWVLSYPWAHSEDWSDLWMPRLIWVFAGHSHFVGFVMRRLIFWLSSSCIAEKQLSITQFCSPVKDLPETNNPQPYTPPKPKGLFSYFNPVKSRDSHLTSEVNDERSEVKNNCDNEMDMFEDNDLFEDISEPQQKKQRTWQWELL